MEANVNPTNEILAIVPARGRSKTVPRKNVRSLAGHPLIAYSIAAGLQAQRVRRVIVSTDDEKIAEISRSYGAEVPFLRPASLAQDETVDLLVFKHALEWLAENEAYHPEIVVQLRPTSPLRPPDCVDRAIEILLENNNSDSVRGVVPSGQNPYKMWRISSEGNLRPLIDNDFVEPYNMPRQQLPQTYWQTGHIDVIRASTILEKGSMSGDIILPLIMDPHYAVDIDTAKDHEHAQWILMHSDLPLIRPGRKVRPLPQKVELVVFDFDGVMTDNRVWVDADGRELVSANRGDGWGVARLKETGTQIVVLSTETNSVVAARCRKLGIEAIQGIKDKAKALRELMESRGIESNQTIYLGNDVNDVVCFPLVACALVVEDAHPEAKSQADIILTKRGGQGAVRELCDILVRNIEESSTNE
jgi:N-acylneuraminate cytidylyltransferase